MGISGPRGVRGVFVVGTVLASLWASSAFAVNVNLVSGSVGADIAVYQELVKPWEEKTGNKVTFVPMPASTTDQFAQYKLWLAAGNKDIDVYLVDVIWAPQLSEQFLDLTPAFAPVVARTTSPRSSRRRRSTASSSPYRSSPTRRRSTTARICSRSTARTFRPPGRK